MYVSICKKYGAAAIGLLSLTLRPVSTMAKQKPDTAKNSKAIGHGDL
jgi:hypothetical protein